MTGPAFAAPRGVIAPNFTPFADDGSIEIDLFIGHAIDLLEAGCVALAPFGTTGEAASVGVDPIQFAVIFLVGASIGFITPPYGLNLYVASGVTGVPYFRLLRYATMYLVSLVIVWFCVAIFPSLSKTLLPGGGLFELLSGLGG